MKQTFRPCLQRSIYTLILLFVTPVAIVAQGVSAYEKQRGQMMLDQIKKDIEDNYYDRTYNGVDLNAVFKAADSKLKTAESNGQILGIIAQAVFELNDSHTSFIPPDRKTITDYGFELQMIGDTAYVSKVKEKSDASQKGLKVGDAVYLVDGYQPARENLWKLIYLYYVLRPQPGMKLTIGSPGGEPRELVVMAKVSDRKSIDLTNYNDFMDLVRESENEESSRKKSHQTQVLEDTFVWKMPRFDLEEDEVDSMMSKARRHKNLILDLRGNPGGYELTLLRLIGNLFDRDLKVGDIQRRKDSKPLLAKTRGDDAFKGNVVVLVDSRSASSSEVLARSVQLEKRGVVIGDRTAGAVMRSRFHQHTVGLTSVAFFGISVTDASLKMSDGGTLERVGVVPDEIILPSGAELAAKSDPVLAHAAKRAGVNIDAQKAGALFADLKKP